MIKIAHLGAYDTNIGDNIAIANVRHWLEHDIQSKVEWKSVHIGKFFEQQNEESYCVKKFQEISNQCDVLIVGGGGLIEGGGYKKMHNGYKLPFTKKVFDVIDIPIICFGLGVNLFRGMDRLTKQGIDNLSLLIQEAAAFSVRSDGSYELLMDMAPSLKIREIPDPGVMMPWQKDRLDELKKGCFQPGFNKNKKVNAGRRMTPKNMKLIEKIIHQHNLTVMPHTKKDYVIQDVSYAFSIKHLQAHINLNQFMELVEVYHQFDYSVAMRGHGQLMAVGLNIPSIYLSTQDKVRGFSQLHGFDEYNVDIEDDEWRDKLVWRLECLLNNPLAWYRIRDRYMECAKAAYKGFNESAAKICLERSLL